MGENLHFLSPIDGDMLHANDGEFRDGKLVIQASAAAAPGAAVRIGDSPASEREPGVFTAEVALPTGRSTLTASCGVESAAARVTVLDGYVGHYRLSIDDAVWFLRDLTDHAYPSLFDNPFMKLLREVHDCYGTKIHVNLYYRDGESFTIAAVPDRYRAEWQEKADWLRLSFHARADQPDEPYKDAAYDRVLQDVRDVRREALRFAGEELWGDVTTLHWGAATADGCRALRDSGYRVLVGDFNVDDHKSPVSYYFDLAHRRHIKRRFIWRDPDSDVIFFRSAIIVDTHPLEEIEPFLDEIKNDPLRAPYIDLLIHEQYFYPSYPRYQSDYREKILTAVGWAVKNGYRPAFLQDALGL